MHYALLGAAISCHPSKLAGSFQEIICLLSRFGDNTSQKTVLSSNISLNISSSLNLTPTPFGLVSSC